MLSVILLTGAIMLAGGQQQCYVMDKGTGMLKPTTCRQGNDPYPQGLGVQCLDKKTEVVIEGCEEIHMKHHRPNLGHLSPEDKRDIVEDIKGEMLEKMAPLLKVD